MARVHSVTSVEEPTSVRNARRMRRYLITMAIRCAGLVGAVVTEGWMRWVSIVLAIALPYVAVVLGSESVGTTEGLDPYSEEPRQLQPPSSHDPARGLGE